MGKKPLHKSFKHPGGYIGLPRRVFESENYRSLSLRARCVLDELQNLHRPGRNGRIAFSVTQAAQRLNVTENTAAPAFHELAQRGFIALSQDGDWRKGKAREWRLTYEPHNGREPTDDWYYWEDEIQKGNS